MWWNALLAAFGLTFVAELGDKTQIIILTLAARHGFRRVFLGAAAAFALLDVLAVSLGALLYRVIPETFITYAVSAVFILFGILYLLPQRKKDEDVGPEEKSGRPVLSSFILVCLMELGDKTQLSLLALAAKYPHPFSVFAGGTLALWLSALIAALVGSGLGRFISQLWMRRISGAIFIAFGIVNLFW